MSIERKKETEKEVGSGGDTVTLKVPERGEKDT